MAKHRRQREWPFWPIVAACYVVLLLWAGSEVFLQTSSGLAPLPSAGATAPTPPPFVAAKPPPVPVDTTPVPKKVNYKSCKEVAEKGKLPLIKGQPGYRKGLDSDGDGKACENYY